MSLLTTFNYSNHQSEGEEVVVEGKREKVRKLKLTWCTCCLLGQSHKCFDCERNSYSQTTSVNIGFQWPYTQAMPNDFEVKSTIAF